MFTHSSPQNKVSPWKNKLETAQGCKFESFVFMKANVSDENNPRLTELAMIAVHRCDITTSDGGDNPQSEALPRINEKLVMCFNPTVPIVCQDSVNSNLTLEQLKRSRKSVFDEKAALTINAFLKNQPPPVCLLAHNGFLVDFVVLKSELEFIGKNLFGREEDRLFCIDTITFFKNMDERASDGNLTSLDLGKYTIERVYRRFYKQIPALKCAKDHAVCLWKIFKSCHLTIMDNLPVLKFCFSPVRKRLKIVDEDLNQGPDFERQYREEVCTDNSIQTYVFLDLETTGLDVNDDSIVELCMIAVDRSEVAFHPHADPSDLDWSEIIPRVYDEDCFQINPNGEIQERAAALNLLTTSELRRRDKKFFTTETSLRLKNFLERLKKPICLIAHNGEQFDFPMLDAHLRRARPVDPMWSDIFLADSMVGLRELGRTESCGLQSVFHDLVGPHLRLDSLAHTAEGDVLRLIAVTMLFPGDLPKWYEENKKKFRD